MSVTAHNFTFGKVLDEHQFHPRGVYISIEGNIGAGKTETWNYIKEHYETFARSKRHPMQTIEEPVESWMDVDGHNLLDAYYKDPKANSFMFQSYALINRATHIAKAFSDAADTLCPDTTPLFFSERSCMTDAVFAEYYANSGNMTPVHAAAYRRFGENIMQLTSYRHNNGVIDHNKDVYHPDAVVYIRTPPTVCQSRIKQRGRKEEDGIPIDMLTQIHQDHDTVLLERWQKRDRKPILVIEYDAKRTPKQTAEEIFAGLFGWDVTEASE